MLTLHQASPKSAPGAASDRASDAVAMPCLPDVYALAEAPLARYRNRGEFVMELATYHHLWQLSTPGGTAAELFKYDRLVGRPFSISSVIDAHSDINVAATADNPDMVYGDFSGYFWVDRVGNGRDASGPVAGLREHALRRHLRRVLLLACRRRHPHRRLARRAERRNHRMTILGGREQITETRSNRVGWFDLPDWWFVAPSDEPPGSFIGCRWGSPTDNRIPTPVASAVVCCGGAVGRRRTPTVLFNRGWRESQAGVRFLAPAHRRNRLPDSREAVPSSYPSDTFQRWIYLPLTSKR